MSILVTGAETAASTMVLQNLHAPVFAGSADPWAPGLFLVPESHRLKLPPPEAPNYTTNLLQICWQNRIRVLIPCGDSQELLKIAHQRLQFERMGVQVMLASAESLACCRDQLALRLACSGIVSLPESSLLNFRFQAEKGPWLIKPRFGSGVKLIRQASRLRELPLDESLLIQEFVEGAVFHVDTLLSFSGAPLAAVVRVPLRMEKGVLVSSRSILHPQLQQLALKVASQLGLVGAASIHFRQDAQGNLKLTKVLPHFQPSMRFSAASGLNLPQLCLQLLQGDQPEIPGVQEGISASYGNTRILAGATPAPAPLLSSPALQNLPAIEAHTLEATQEEEALTREEHPPEAMEAETPPKKEEEYTVEILETDPEPGAPREEGTEEEPRQQAA